MTCGIVGTPGLKEARYQFMICSLQERRRLLVFSSVFRLRQWCQIWRQHHGISGCEAKRSTQFPLDVTG
jgi:hypothetical protein